MATTEEYIDALKSLKAATLEYYTTGPGSKNTISGTQNPGELLAGQLDRLMGDKPMLYPNPIMFWSDETRSHISTGIAFSGLEQDIARLQNVVSHSQADNPAIAQAWKIVLSRNPNMRQTAENLAQFPEQTDVFRQISDIFLRTLPKGNERMKEALRDEFLINNFSYVNTILIDAFKMLAVPCDKIPTAVDFEGKKTRAAPICDAAPALECFSGKDGLEYMTHGGGGSVVIAQVLGEKPEHHELLRRFIDILSTRLPDEARIAGLEAALAKGGKPSFEGVIQSGAPQGFDVQKVRDYWRQPPIKIDSQHPPQKCRPWDHN